MNCGKFILRIVKDTGLSRKEIKEMVDQTIDKLRGEISEEEALLIIIKDLAVELI